MSKKSKFNVAIETALFINSKNNHNIDRKSLIEAIVDYNLFNGMDYDILYSYLESNSMITESDLAIFKEKSTNTSNKVRSIVEAESENPDKNLSAAIKEFKTKMEKNPIRLKDLIVKAYTKTPDQVINNAPKFFDIFRFLVIIGSAGIHPILSVVMFFTDQFLRVHFSRDETNRMILKYEKEIDKVISESIEKIEKLSADKEKDILSV